MMKAAAPITGGISCPPVEPTDSMAAGAVRARSPSAIISGMVTMPTATHVADTRAPEIMPNSAEPTTAILAAPPRKWPIADIARSAKKSRAAGARQHLSHDRERNDDQHGDAEERADHAR